MFITVLSAEKVVQRKSIDMKDIFVLVCLVFASNSWAQVIHQVPGVTVVPQNFSVGSQYYDLNVQGLRKYVDNNNVHELQPTLKKLESQQMVADVTKWSMVGTGALLAVGSFSFLQLDYKNVDGEKEKIWNSTAFIGGALIGFGGFWVAKWIEPGRDDYLDFINKHNSIPNREPLKLNLGWNFGTSQPTFLVRLDF